MSASEKPQPPPHGPEIIRIALPVPLKLLAEIARSTDRHCGKGCVMRETGDFLTIYAPPSK